MQSKQASARSTGVLVAKRLIAALAILLLGHATALGDEIRVMISGGFNGAYQALVPKFEAAAGDRLITARGPSMGRDPTSIPSRLSNGERADVVILVRGALDRLVDENLVMRDSVTNLGTGLIAMAVKSGSPTPDMRSVVAFKRVLLNAKSVGYSDSASGVYLSTVLFRRLGIAKAMAPKSKMVQATPVGIGLAKGEYELGFQQLSELKGIPGITIVGTIPDPLQLRTMFAAGLVTNARNPAGGKKLIAFLRSPAAHSEIESSGLAPAK